MAHPTPRPGVSAGFPARLEAGYRAFLTGRFPSEHRRFAELAETGQSPRILLIGCSDSRVPPETIFDARPGEIFVVRNVANLVPPYSPNDDFHGTSAALEFAVMGLRVEHIVVMGHARCGGVRAFVENELDPYTRPLSPGDFIGKWIRLVQPAFEALGAPDPQDLDNYVEKLTQASIRQSLANLRSFPCVRTLEERGLLRLHGCYFGVMDGRLYASNAETGEFETVAADAHGEAMEHPRF